MSRLLFHALFLGTTLLAILNFHWLVAGLAFLLWMIREVMQAVIINRTAKEQGEDWKYYLTLPLFDLLLPLQNFKVRLYRLYRGKSDFMRR
ncbi:hypothetical protein SDC9_122200 [bioreactor metagenome]|uniref:Uncharacterized protein n=1 Tax=bioreactor metagenome TaxID=1076179 RepID=A0A645CE27_9ZZZZ